MDYLSDFSDLKTKFMPIRNTYAASNTYWSILIILGGGEYALYSHFLTLGCWTFIIIVVGGVDAGMVIAIDAIATDCVY